MNLLFMAKSFCSILLITLLVTGCNISGNIKKHGDGDGDIIIAAIWSQNRTDILFSHGLELAAEKINRGGGVLGRNIKFEYFDDGASVTKALQIDQEITSNKKYSAVLGHTYSYITIPAVPVFEKEELILFSTSSSASELTDHGYRFFFRNIPGNREIGKNLAHYADFMGFKKIMICYSKNEYGRSMANAFEDEGTELDIDITDRVSYVNGTLPEFENLIRKWSFYEYDAIFFAGDAFGGTVFARTARRMGVSHPVFGGDMFEDPYVIREGGDSVNGITYVSLYNVNSDYPENIDFVKAFREKFNRDPDDWAANSYDAVLLICEAIRSARSSSSPEIAESLRNMKNFRSVNGNCFFLKNGDIVNKDLYMKRISNGKTEYFFDLGNMKMLTPGGIEK